MVSQLKLSSLLLELKCVFLRVPTLLFPGNMGLKFENAGTSLIVKQYLDRSREVLRQELLNKASELLI